MGLLKDLGCDVTDVGILPDKKDVISIALAKAAQDHDVVLTSGGVSTGEEDHVKAAVEQNGSIHFWRLSIKPGRPIALGQVADAAFVGLPGNPAAAIVSFEVFVRPGLRKLQGCSRVLPEIFEVRFPFEQHYKPGRVFLLRTRVEPAPEGGGYEVVRPGEQDSSFLASLAQANAIVVLPPEGGPVPEGATRPAFWMGGAGR